MTEHSLMADKPAMISTFLTDTPHEVRVRILSGMRWTLWLSAFSVPFGFGTNLILARTSPEALGTYGLLSLYLSILTSVFYLGGDAVVMKFIPGLSTQRRFSFLMSYFLIICMALGLVITFAALWPDKLHFLFGTHGDNATSLWILISSPIYVCFLMVIATLKGMLEIRLAQILLRLVTIACFLIYLLLFVLAAKLFAVHYTSFIWGIYLGLVTVATVIGVCNLFRLNNWRSSREYLHFYLPNGFWHYMFATQQLSLLSFFSARIDYLLILNLGSLDMLGKYVAISAVSGVIPVVNSLFVDTILPSLTNLLAADNASGASQIAGVYLRVLFAVSASITCGLILFSSFFTFLFGPKYSSVHVPIVAMVLLTGLAAPGGAGGTLLTSVGKQQNAVWVAFGQVGIYAGLFFVLWPKYQLLGAVLAFGLANLVCSVLLLCVAQRIVHINFAFGREYSVFIFVAVACAAVVLRISLGFAAASITWFLAVALFLRFSRYTVQECTVLGHCFLPHRLTSFLAGFTRQHDTP